MDADSLLSVARDCETIPGTPSEDVAESFLAAHPWSEVADALRRAVEEDETADVRALCALCEKMSATTRGIERLAREAGALAGNGAFDAWLASSSASARALACALVGRVFERASAEAEARALAEATRNALATALATDETEVAHAASRALLFACARFGEGLSETLGVVLAATASERGGEATARGLAFAASAAAANDAAADAVSRSGALDACVREIESDDLLAASAAMEILAEVAESSKAAASGLRRIPSLSATLVRLALSDDADVGVRMRAIVVSGRIAGTSPSRDDAIVQDVTRALVTLFAEEISRDVHDAVVDAAGAICLSNADIASAFVVSSKNAVFDVAHRALRGSGESQVIALHALANICGAERGEGRTLSDDAESIIADACFTVCGSKTFGDVVCSSITVKSDHFLAARVAMFRALSALGFRRPFAEEIAAHPEARRTLCHDHERTAVASKFRLAALRALAAAGVRDAVAANDFSMAATAAPTATSRPVARPDVAVAHR